MPYPDSGEEAHAARAPTPDDVGRGRGACSRGAQRPDRLLRRALTLTHLYVVAFIVGTFDVTFAVAYQALLVAMVNRKDYLAANSLLNGTRSLAEVVGLALGGTLGGLLTAPVALQLNAVSFVVSGSQLARIHPSSPHLTPPAHAASAAGSTGSAATRWCGRYCCPRPRRTSSPSSANALLVLYASRTLGLNPTVIGLVFGAGAVGGVISAATCSRVERRLGLGRVVLLTAFAFPLAMLLYPAARGSTLSAALVLGAGEFLAAIAALWLDISVGVVFAQEIPDQLRSRVAGAYRTVNHGIRPVGALLGGVLGTHWATVRPAHQRHRRHRRAVPPAPPGQRHPTAPERAQPLRDGTQSAHGGVPPSPSR